MYQIKLSEIMELEDSWLMGHDGYEKELLTIYPSGWNERAGLALGDIYHFYGTGMFQIILDVSEPVVH